MHKYKNIKEGRAGITARVVAKSRCARTGKVIITFEIDYPRIIHSELMTHRMFSRNAASSRAIPIKKTIEQVRTNPARPVEFGKNQPGMQAKEVLTGKDHFDALFWWNLAASNAASCAEDMDARLGLQ